LGAVAKDYTKFYKMAEHHPKIIKPKVEKAVISLALTV
jgi:hypothetical protein